MPADLSLLLYVIPGVKIYVIVGVVLVWMARSPLSRSGHVIRILGGGVVALIGSMANIDIHSEDEAVRQMFVMIGAYNLFLYRWNARRLLDLDTSRWWALLTALPIVDLFLTVGLCFRVSKLSTTGADQPSPVAD